MNNYHSMLFLITASISLILVPSQAKNITLTIEGQGEVHIKETEYKCTDNCKLTSNLALNTLVPTASHGWTFSGWSGQQCDSGSQVIISDKSQKLLTEYGGAKTIKTADINGDNLDDFVTIGLFNGQISSNINKGDGTFELSTIDSNKNYPTALDLFDADADGDLDLYVAVFGSGVIKVYLNNGLGTFTFSKNIIINGIKPYSFKVLDKNDDGQNDILISSFSANILKDLWVLVKSIRSSKTQWYIKDLDNYIPEEVISEEAAMTIDAYKKDGIISIVAAEIENGVVAQYRSGVRTIVSSGVGAYGAAFGDIDKDGNIDVLAAHYLPPTLNLIYGGVNGTFSNTTVVATPKEGMTATSFGDYNNDGLIDVATSEFNKRTFYYFPTSSYQHCVISTEGDISLTATFIGSSSDSSSSNGGGISYLVLLLLSITIMSRKKTPSPLPFRLTSN